MAEKKARIVGGFVAITHETMDHAAFRKLSESAIRVYLHCLRKVGPSSDRYSKIFKFTYPEAKNRLKLSDSTFQRAMQQLHQFGFINYYSPGGSGMKGDKKIPKGYRLSLRWKAWGKIDFETRHEKQYESIND